ncbi:MAG: IPTL-CTERM sorting domain-containing protein, partial [Desulfobacterales bacterium]|nr:IPTL-CTERM sorting domain-containing protein [Desulfobacterales bacterium]
LVDVTGTITLIEVEASSTSWDGIAIYGCQGEKTITRCTGHSSYDDGFSISSSDERDSTGNVTITDSTAYGNNQDGFQLNMQGDVRVEDCLSENNDDPEDPDNDEDGFQFWVDGNITVDGCTARNNGQEGIDIEYCAGDAVITGSTSQNNGGEGIDTDVLGYSLLIERCRSLSNDGQGIQVAEIGAPEGSITISCNDIVGNYEGLNLYQAATVEAINNWWGDISGPAAYGNPGGTGDSIVIEQGGTVNYSPWLTTVFSRSETCGGSQNIPTLSEWGMITMAILLAAIAMKFMVRRRQAV